MKTKTVKVAIDSFGSFLGREKGCLVVRDQERKVKKYPLFENSIAEIRLSSGNTVSAGALASCAFWDINLIVTTQFGNPIAVLKRARRLKMLISREMLDVNHVINIKIDRKKDDLIFQVDLKSNK